MKVSNRFIEASGSMNELTQEGIRLFQSGDKQGAARVLASAVQMDARDEEAWYWLSACVDNLDKKRYCLQRVLKINPLNVKARRRLDRLEEISQPGSATIPLRDMPPPRRRPAFRAGGLLLVIALLLGATLAYAAFNQRSAGNDPSRNFASEQEAPLSESAGGPPLAKSAPDAVLIPLTGDPVLLSGEGSMESAEFALPAGRVRYIWQYSGSADEEFVLAAINEQRDMNLRAIDAQYMECMKERKADLDFALLQQKPEAVTLAEQAIEQCIQRYESAKREENTRYYQEIDSASTTITITINRRRVDDPVVLVDMHGIYYGVSDFEAAGADDYYLSVTSSGPWSVRFE